MSSILVRRSIRFPAVRVCNGRGVRRRIPGQSVAPTERCFFSAHQRQINQTPWNQLRVLSSFRSESVKQNDAAHYFKEEAISIYEMNANHINQITDLRDLEEIVHQLEAIPNLARDDIRPLVIPLMKKTSQIEFGEPGARLTERILFQCLGRLPPNRKDRVGKHLLFPTNTMYNVTMIAWGNLRSEAAAERAQRIFELLVSEHLQEKELLSKLGSHLPSNAPQPCRRCYKSLIRAWTISGAKSAAAKSYHFLRQLEEESGVVRLLDGDSNDLEQQATVQFPDRAIYNLVISAYAKVPVLGHPRALNRAKAIAKRLDRLNEITDRDEYAMDGYTYHAILQAYSRYTAFCNEKLPVSYSQEIEDLLKRICSEKRPAISETISEGLSMPWAYGVLVDALIKTDQAGAIHRAQSVTLGIAKRSGGMKLPKLRPGDWPRHDTLIRLVKAWERTGIPEAQQYIDQLLRLAIEAPYDRVHLLNAGMAEWVKSGYQDTPRLLEAILDRNIDDRSHRRAVTGQTFAIVIRAWLRDRSDDAPHRAELLLQKLIELYARRGTSRYEPREVHMRYVLTAWLNVCSDGRRYLGLAGFVYPAEHSEALILQVCREPWLQKHLIGVFAQGIRAWALQEVGSDPDEPNVVERASALLSELEGLVGILPAFACNWVLQTCSRPQPTLEYRQQAYHTAIDTFRRGQRNGRSYVLLIEVLLAQTDELDQDHLEIIESLFQECCSGGMLTQELVWHVANVLSVEALKRLFGISHQYATYITKVRGDMGLSDGDEIVRWNGCPPSALLVSRLPPEWSQKVTGIDKKS